jgi:hypothetical protein
MKRRQDARKMEVEEEESEYEISESMEKSKQDIREIADSSPGELKSMIIHR